MILSVRKFRNVEEEFDNLCVLNAMQMDVYIAGLCIFAIGMRMGCDCWETSLQRGTVLSAFFHWLQTSSEKISLFKNNLIKFEIN